MLAALVVIARDGEVHFVLDIMTLLSYVPSVRSLSATFADTRTDPEIS
jgi:hypothetical protein